MKNLSKDELKKIVQESTSKTEVILKLGYSKKPNGRTWKKVNNLLKDYDTSHFNKRDIVKICPVCDSEFNVKEGDSKVTCSYACSNTYFRSGRNNPNWNEDYYRTTCFLHHKKECVICGEDRIVEVHHLDENHSNNSPENLIPLCPTHHKYWHSRYKHLIEPEILKYIKNYKK